MLLLLYGLGARVIATAGTAEKSEYLRRVFGLEHVFSSRSTSFVDDVLDVTHNAGVDVILNSLVGDLMLANFRLLRPYARFIEVGKRNIYSSKNFSLYPLRQNVSYFVLDLMSMFHSRPEVIRHALQEVLSGIQRGHLKPLPFQRFSRSNVQEAFYRIANGSYVSFSLHAFHCSFSLSLMEGGGYLFLMGICVCVCVDKLGKWC